VCVRERERERERERAPHTQSGSADSTHAAPRPQTHPPHPPNPQVEARIVGGLLQLIERERHGEAVDRPLIASLLRMLKDLGLYARRFEAPFLAETAAFYRAEGASKVVECDTAAYLEHCEVRVVGWVGCRCRWCWCWCWCW